MKQLLNEFLQASGRRVIFDGAFAKVVETSGPCRPRRWVIFDLRKDGIAPRRFDNQAEADIAARLINQNGWEREGRLQDLVHGTRCEEFWGAEVCPAA